MRARYSWRGILYRTALAIFLVSASYAFQETITAIGGAGQARAADETQEITLGPHTFYIPKLWMTGSILAVNPNETVSKPRSVAIHAEILGLTPQPNWQPFDSNKLPQSIDITFLPQSVLPPLDAQTKQWLAEANVREPDRDNFVLVSATPFRPGAKPMYETFVYKNYLDNLGQPLIIEAENSNSPAGNRALSNVYTAAQPNLTVHYRFDVVNFPESEWWPLYQRTLAFLDFLQKPK